MQIEEGEDGTIIETLPPGPFESFHGQYMAATNMVFPPLSRLEMRNVPVKKTLDAGRCGCHALAAADRKIKSSAEGTAAT